MRYYNLQNARTRQRYERDLGHDPVVRQWLADVATRAAKPQTTVTFLDPFPYDEIRMWTCDRCGCHVPTTVYGHKICGFCSSEGRERSWVKPEVRKKLLEARIEDILDD